MEYVHHTLHINVLIYLYFFNKNKGCAVNKIISTRIFCPTNNTCILCFTTHLVETSFLADNLIIVKAI